MSPRVPCHAAFGTLAAVTVKDILAQLKSLGDEARRKHNTKAGAPDNQFGVKLGDVRAPRPPRKSQSG